MNIYRAKQTEKALNATKSRFCEIWYEISIKFVNYIQQGTSRGSIGNEGRGHI